VEEREIRAAATGREPIDLGSRRAHDLAPDPARRPRNRPEIHARQSNLARAPMPSPRRFARLLADRRVPIRTRLGLFSAEGHRRLRPRPAYRVPHGQGEVFLSHADFAIDWESLKFVVADHAYATDYRDAVVLDVGAHKGYFGAHALAHGARVVISFEPERANVELLERAASSFRARGKDWRVRPVAVGADEGEAELHVMSASWGHALHPPAAFAEHEVGTQRVPVVAAATILAEAHALAGPRGRLVVKVNIEGEECATVLKTPTEAWRDVDELFVETHLWATCGAAELAEHLAPAGFTRAESQAEVVLRLRRATSPRSGRRTAPS
jgi:FkbM family methyltransferase